MFWTSAGVGEDNQLIVYPNYNCNYPTNFWEDASWVRLKFTVKTNNCLHVFKLKWEWEWEPAAKTCKSSRHLKLKLNTFTFSRSWSWYFQPWIFAWSQPWKSDFFENSILWRHSIPLPSAQLPPTAAPEISFPLSGKSVWKIFRAARAAHSNSWI